VGQNGREQWNIGFQKGIGMVGGDTDFEELHSCKSLVDLTKRDGVKRTEKAKRIKKGSE
jgi:hypothetical protein